MATPSPQRGSVAARQICRPAPAPIPTASQEEVVMLSRRLRTMWTGPRGQAGVTLLEVLTAIFVMAIGLLALLTLFPLGALEMAQAIEDDRAGAAAQSAVALSQAGEDLLSRTVDFATASLANGSVDPKTLAHLREEYEALAVQAEEVDAMLRELESIAPPPKIRRHLAPLLAQLRAIKVRFDLLARLLWLVQR
jgi:hypothetical protein